MTTAHPTAEMLAGYAGGSLSDGMSLLVASHLTFCPQCRSRVAQLETLCGALLRDAAEATPSAACLAGALARLDDDPTEPPAPCAEPGCALPAPLRLRIGVPASRIRWRFLLPGLAERRLHGFPGEEVRLVRARSGVGIPRHTHEGEEAMLILTGRLRDGERVYARGDVALADGRDDHRPEVIGSETCVCLMVLTAPLRFTGPLGRVLNRLARRVGFRTG